MSRQRTVDREAVKNGEANTGFSGPFSLLHGEPAARPDTRRLVGIVLTCTLALASASAAAAQGIEPARMEFDAVVRQALEKNPTVARAATTIARAEALLQQAHAVTLPLVTTNVTNTTLDSARGFAGGVTQPQNQFVFSASASMPVLAATRWAAVGQARDQVEVASASVAEVRQQVAVSAAQTYLAVIAAHRQVAVTERSLANARAHLDYATRRFEGGAGSRLNQVRAAQVVSAEETRLESARLALLTAQEALGAIVVADGPVDVGAEPVFDQPAMMEADAWRTSRPDLITQAAVQRAAERVVQDGWRDWVPTVNASFDPAFVTPRGLFQPSRTWRLTFTATFVLFEGGQRRVNDSLRAITLDQAKLTMSTLEIRAQSEVRLAQEAVRSRERALQSATRAAEQAADVVAITTSAFEVGATTNLEVLDAQRAARDADTTVAVAEDGLRRARLDLLVALGRFRY